MIWWTVKGAGFRPDENPDLAASALCDPGRVSPSLRLNFLLCKGGVVVSFQVVCVPNS